MEVFYMKNMQSTDNLKQLFTSIQFPPIDVRDQVMERIQNKKGVKKYMTNKKRLAVVLVLVVFVICAVGFSALKVIDLRGPGNTSYSFQLIDKGDPLPDKEMLQTEYEKLQPGQTLAWMKVHNNPNQTIQLFQKPLILNNYEDLSARVESGFASPAYLPAGYTFQDGQIGYHLDNAVAEEMKAECKTTDKDYLIHVYNPSSTINNYSINYRNGDQGFNISLFFDWKGTDIFEVNRGTHAEKVKIKDFEAVYTDSDGRTEIKWLESENGSNTFYSIGAPSGFLSKEELIKIAESMN